MKSKSRQDVKIALNDLITHFELHVRTVTYLSTDDEKIFSSLKQWLAQEDKIKLLQKPPGCHEPTVERATRSLKDYARSITASLPFRLPRSLITSLLIYCMQSHNLVVSSASWSHSVRLTPYEQVTSRKPNHKLLNRAPFGAFITAVDPNRTSVNHMQPRTSPGVFVGRSGNGAISMLKLSNGHIVRRDKFIVGEHTPNSIQAMNDMCGDNKTISESN